MATDDETSDEQPTTDERALREPRPLVEPTGDRYRLGERIGRGGMGEVLAAHDDQIGREVAVKRLRAKDPSDNQITRFLHEARIQGRLDHPAIVPVHELGRDRNGLPFFAMRKLAGTTLVAHLKSRRLGRRPLLRAFADVCLAVEYAHVRGVIHRDLKPENIVLGEFGEVYVLDWGVAKVIGDAEWFDDLRGAAAHAPAVVGTPAYMSPEQARGAADVDVRTDVFSLGRVLAEILASDGDPLPELDSLCDQATSEARDDRPSSARAVGEEVQRYLDGDRDHMLRHGLALEHLERARRAFAYGNTDELRRVAIREAGSALALDPALDGAAELVGRLMLEPPGEIPVEVEHAIAADDGRSMTDLGRAALWGNLLGTVALIPIVIATGAWWIGAVSVALIAFNMVGSVNAIRHQRYPSWATLAIGNGLLLVVIAHAFSPMVVAPTIAALFAVTLASNPFLVGFASTLLTGAAIVGGLILPWLAERIGLIPTTFEVTDAGYSIHAVALSGSPPFADFMFVMSILVTVIVGMATGRITRAGQRAVRRQLHLQAWQLRQLVPDPVAR